MLRQASKVTLYDDVVAQLQELVARGDLKPGDRLPAERELSSQLGVSRATLREALKGLELMGVIKIKHGDGTFIREDINARLVSQPLRFISPAQSSLMVELLETRQAIESTAARLAAQRVQDDDIAGLRHELSEMRKALAKGDTAEVSKHDLEFHLALCKASRNSILYQVERSIQNMLLEAMETTIFIPSALQSAIEYHDKILAAVENRDAEAAFTLMLDHLRAVQRDIQESTTDSRDHAEQQ
ncbi:MAG: FadR family transcriptional regulator [Firmicutes bacterium]|nr:FadR family transcriptional regulator [Bacillota bacterium]